MHTHTPSHTLAATHYTAAYNTTQFGWHDWPTDNKPQTQEWTTYRPLSSFEQTTLLLPRTPVSRIHFSSAGLEKANATQAPSFIDETVGYASGPHLCIYVFFMFMYLFSVMCASSAAVIVSSWIVTTTNNRRSLSLQGVVYYKIHFRPWTICNACKLRRSNCFILNSHHHQ